MRTAPPLLLPIACEGISPAVRRALRYAGVPCVDFAQPAPSKRDTRFVLTDSRFAATGAPRNDHAVRNSKPLSHTGRSRVIDVQTLDGADAVSTLDDRTVTQSIDFTGVRRRPLSTTMTSPVETLLNELKSVVEKQGGMWARVADFPYPYRAAVCEGTPDELAQLAGIFGQVDADPSRLDEISSVDQLYRVYLAGGLILRPRETALSLVETLDVSFDDTDDGEPMPLLWRTNCRDFVRWWQIRERLQFSMTRHAHGFAVRCSGESKQWRPAIEVWKNSHLATLPWVANDFLWKTGQHVWGHERHKHPTGIFSFATLMEQACVSRYEIDLKQSA